MAFEQIETFALGGGLGSLVPLLLKAKETLIKQAKKKENRERLSDALRSLDNIENCLKKSKELAISVSEIIRNAQEAPTQNDAEQLYAKVADIFENMARMHSSFRQLCKEAKTISEFDFIEEVKLNDRKSYALIMFFAKCYRKGKVDISELPMFISLYGPKPKANRKHEKVAEDKLAEYAPVLAKTKRIANKLPRPVIRTTMTRLRRSFIDLGDQANYIEKLDDDVATRLQSQSPDWMAPLNELLNDAFADFEKAMEQRGFRAQGKKVGPPPHHTARWPIR
jgi:hypothetical protein